MPENEPNKTKPSKKNYSEAYRYTGMATKMAVVILIGVLGGQKLDEKLNTQTPWFTIVLSLVSVAAAIYIVISDTSKK